MYIQANPPFLIHFLLDDSKSENENLYDVKIVVQDADGDEKGGQKKHTLILFTWIRILPWPTNLQAMISLLRIRIYYYVDPDPGSQKCPNGSGSKGENSKEEKLHQKMFN